MFSNIDDEIIISTDVYVKTDFIKNINTDLTKNQLKLFKRIFIQSNSTKNYYLYDYEIFTECYQDILKLLNTDISRYNEYQIYDFYETVCEKQNNNFFLNDLQIKFKKVPFYNGYINDNEHCICRNYHNKDRVRAGYSFFTTIEDFVDDHTDECEKFRNELPNILNYNEKQLNKLKKYKLLFNEMSNNIVKKYILSEEKSKNIEISFSNSTSVSLYNLLKKSNSESNDASISISSSSSKKRKH